MAINGARRAGGHHMQVADVPKFSSPTVTHRWPTSVEMPVEYLKKGDGDRIKLGMLKKPEAPLGPPKARGGAQLTTPARGLHRFECVRRVLSCADPRAGFKHFVR